MTARFNNLRRPLKVLTTGEIMTTWIGVVIGVLLVVAVGFLLGQYFPQSYG